MKPTSNVLRLCLVAGARPNFMKIAPLMRAIAREPRLSAVLVHTGQHYDTEMSDVFFDDLGIPPPDHRLDVGSGSHAKQTARVMMAFEDVCLDERPDAVVVVGDVNSTVAAALVASKLHIPVAHVEAGLRSGDRTMPEEINRLATDAISDLLFATEAAAVVNLEHEGHPHERIHFVGHVMVDNLLHQVERLSQTSTPMAHDDLKRTLGRYGVVTLHRPSNVDSPATLRGLLDALAHLARDLPLVMPLHPRTRASIDALGLTLPEGIHVLPPLPHLVFLNLWRDAQVVLTDSGGLQEETTALGVPCVTLRDSTERPITLTHGSNLLAGSDPEQIVAATRTQLARGRVALTRPPLWDGRASERIVEVLCQSLGASASAPRLPERSIA